MSLSETLRVFPAHSFEVAPDKSIRNSGKYQHVEKKPKASFKAAVIYIFILTSCFMSHSFIGLVPSCSSHCFQQSCTDGFSRLDGTCCSASNSRQSPTLTGEESEYLESKPESKGVWILHLQSSGTHNNYSEWMLMSLHIYCLCKYAAVCSEVQWIHIVKRYCSQPPQGHQDANHGICILPTECKTKQTIQHI